MNKFFLAFLIPALIGVLFSSCRSLNSNRMFKTSKEYRVDSIQKELLSADKNYIIQKNDYLTLSVYSHGGERIIDPDFELSKQQTFRQTGESLPRYLVKTDGYVHLPMVGNIYLDGYTLYQADSLLSIEYSKFYKNPFVITKLDNKRVVVIGPEGGKVIPLGNDNMNLVEILALYGGINEYGKAYNIKIIRGDLNNPDVSIIDLSTIEGMRKSNLSVMPNDIIYIESSKRLLTAALRDVAPVISLVTSLLLTILFLRGQ